jgi:hypothetical protein
MAGWQGRRWRGSPAGLAFRAEAERRRACRAETASVKAGSVGERVEINSHCVLTFRLKSGYISIQKTACKGYIL